MGVVFNGVAVPYTGDSFIYTARYNGANSLLTMVDGFPTTRQSVMQSVLIHSNSKWFNLGLFGIPYCHGIPTCDNWLPELWAFTVLALATVGFVSTKFWFRSLCAIAIGIFLGMVGVDPTNNEPRFTLDWFYLEDGIQLIPVVAGLFAIPELVSGLFQRTQTAAVVKSEVVEGMRAFWKNRWLGLRGGFIGAFIGLLPGLGGAMADWMAYGSAVASNPKERFGNGNIKGVIGPEGANNAQKATSMIPTVLFGIPGAPFAAVLMSLFMYLNFELGTPDLAYDTEFFTSMTFGFLSATVIVAILCIFLIKPISYITSVPYKYYFPILLAVITWSSMQYTGGWEDFAMLVIFSCIGFVCRHYKFSRPALLIGFILSEKIEKLSIQMSSLYDIESLITRPIFMILVVFIIGIFAYSFMKKGKIDYA